MNKPKKTALMSLALVFMFIFGSINVSAEAEKVLLSEYSKKVQRFTTVDIRSVVNRGFSDDVPGDGKGGWTDQGDTNDMSCFKLKGKVRLCGIDFDIIDPNKNNGKSALILRGQNDTSVPLEAEIEVNEKFTGAYFLHAAPWLDGAEPVGEYVFNYDDGTSETVSVSGEKEIFNWWNGGKSDYSKVCWSANNDSSTVALSVFPAVNPYPDKTVKSIIARAYGKGPYLALTAVTLTDAGPYLPYEEEKNIGNPDTEDWFEFKLPVTTDLIENTAMDVSFLQDAPAGKHGKIKADGENMYFEDGTRAKFWGTTLVGEALYKTYDDAAATAKRISQLGFNAVRFHALKCGEVTDIGGSTNTATTSRRRNMLSVENMDKLCYFISELKKNGIYYCFDLETGGPALMDENDQDIFSYPTITKGPAFFDPDIKARQKRYTDQFLSYYNPYTKTKIGQDSACIMAALYNEVSLFSVNSFDWDYYYPILKKYYNEWLVKKYPTREALESAWTQDGDIGYGLLENENQLDGSVDVYDSSKRKKVNAKRFEDNMRFIGDIQINNFTDRIKQIRSLGGDFMVEGSTAFISGTCDTANMYSQALSTDFFSLQIYLFLASGNGEKVMPGTKISAPFSQLTASDAFPIGAIANRKIFGKPYFQTEWDASALNPYSCELWLTMPAAAAFQNWNPFQFGWGTGSLVQRDTEHTQSILWGTHEVADRPVQNVFPAMALMFRRGDISEADKGYILTRFQNEEAYKKENQMITYDASMSFVGKTGVAFDNVDYDSEYNNNDVLKIADYGNKTGKYVSVTDELMWDRKNGTFRVNTDRTQAACGYLSLEPTELNDATFDMSTEYSTVFLSSLSDDPISSADKMLLSLIGDYRNTDQVMTEDGTTIVNGGREPIIEEPIEGTITLKSHDSFKVYALDPFGRRNSEIKVTKDENGFSQFCTESQYKTNNYEIVRTEKSLKTVPNKKISYLTDEMTADCFDDLDGYEQDKDKIERIYLQEYMKPVGERKFAPSQSITRDYFASLLVDLFGFATDDEAQCSFKDVLKTNENYKKITAAEQNGIITGDKDGNFRPDDAISKQDMLVMTKKALALTMKTRNEPRSGKTANAAAVSDYAEDAVNYMIKYGYADEEDDFLKNASRADACKLIYNILWE